MNKCARNIIVRKQDYETYVRQSIKNCRERNNQSYGSIVTAEMGCEYDYDEDDDFDETYATIYFKHPEGYEDLLAEMAEGTLTPSEKWDALLKAMGAK